MTKRKFSAKQIRAQKKFAAMARKRAKAARKKRKNPFQMVAFKKGVKGSTKKSKMWATPREKRPLKNILKMAKGKRSKSPAVRKARSKIRKFLKASDRNRKSAKAFAKRYKKAGYQVKVIKVSPKSVLASARAERRRKRGKRKLSRKESKVAKKRRKKIKSRRRKSPRRRKASSRRRKSGRRKARRGRTIVLKRKGQGVYIRRNPNLKQTLEQYSGFKVEELGSLLVGGAVYGTVEGLAARYAPGIYAMAAKVPVIGTTIVPAAIGVALNYAGKQFKVNALSLLGEGILGAAVVAMGIQASQFLPGIAPAPVSGVDFTPGRGVLMGGYARDGADFGNVDFTPGPGVLMGQPQLGMQAQMGDTASWSRDGADFGLVPEGLGLVPEGLGGLG